MCMHVHVFMQNKYNEEKRSIIWKIWLPTLYNNVYAILSLPYQVLKDVFCLQLIWYYVVLVAYHL